MKVNANYTWLKCLDCGEIKKILPGQTIDKDSLIELLSCDCEVVKPKRKKVV